jgi:hypothetical protein
MDWAEDNAFRFRAELLASNQSLASQIVEKLVMSALQSEGEQEAH